MNTSRVPLFSTNLLECNDEMFKFSIQFSKKVHDGYKATTKTMHINLSKPHTNSSITSPPPRETWQRRGKGINTPLLHQNVKPLGQKVNSSYQFPRLGTTL
jgi:hypothetical protein